MPVRTSTGGRCLEIRLQLQRQLPQRGVWYGQGHRKALQSIGVVTQHHRQVHTVALRRHAQHKRIQHFARPVAGGCTRRPVARPPASRAGQTTLGRSRRRNEVSGGSSRRSGKGRHGETPSDPSNIRGHDTHAMKLTNTCISAKAQGRCRTQPRRGCAPTQALGSVTPTCPWYLPPRSR